MSDTSPAPAPAPGTIALAPLDRAALERVLARATELQALSSEPPEGLNDTQLLELGQEVGISSEHLRQALAEERTRVALPSEQGVVGSWFGSIVAAASRVVPGTPAQVLGLIDGWMQREELLRVRRRTGDRLTWETRRDFMGTMQASFNLGGRAYALTQAAEVGATVVAVDDRRVLVRLDADYGGSRRRNVRWASVTAGMGVTSSAGVVALASLSGEPGALLVGGVVGSPDAAGGRRRASPRRSAGRWPGQLALEQPTGRYEISAARSPLMEFLRRCGDRVGGLRLALGAAVAACATGATPEHPVRSRTPPVATRRAVRGVVFDSLPCARPMRWCSWHWCCRPHVAGALARSDTAGRYEFADVGRGRTCWDSSTWPSIR